MELVGTKKSKNRQRKRYMKNKQRRARRKIEVKGIIRRQSITNDISSMANGEWQTHAINAQSFWENYQTSYQWNQRHKLAWLKSRCYALEHENEILRLKVRSLGDDFEQFKALHGPKDKTYGQATMNEARFNTEEKEDDDGEKFVFHVDDNMLEFLEQSARHKLELKRAKEAEKEAADMRRLLSPVQPIARCIHRDHASLYGEASPKILAMEAALQATTERHRNRARPDYWPNIPLQP